ncbi:hypothetical protein F5Y15DRAFT_102319 [Xylariaceae sp. FL0016]|nr:hypothetical protein F5Y15DRAFT_102319 [Xylariaceae sp. FL0016]
MARYMAMDRRSVVSGMEDQFYSAPSSQAASRHVSIMASYQNPAEEVPDIVNSRKRPSEPLVSICEPTTAAESAEQLSTSGKAANDPNVKNAGSEWPASASTLHQDGLKPHHFCPTVLGHQIRRTKSRSSEPLPPSNMLVQNDYTTPVQDFLTGDSLLSSPAPAVTSRHWSSVNLDSDELAAPTSSRMSATNQNKGTTSKQGIEGIVCNIRAYLFERRHDDCLQPMGSTTLFSENQAPNSQFRLHQTTKKDGCSKTPTEHYLIDTHDIYGIVDIVMAGLRCNHRNSIQTDCQTTLFPKEQPQKPRPRVKILIPGTSEIAEPATTLSCIQPSFSLKGCSGGHSHRMGSSKSTFVSRQSVTEIT